MSQLETRSVGVVGVGQVGAAAAYTLFQNQVASKIVLVDKDPRRAEGEAMDLMHGQAYVGRVSVESGGYERLQNAGVVIIAAGVGQRPGESRLSLLSRNAEVFREIAKGLDEHAPEAVLVIATNPVDVLTYVMQELTERPDEHVIGTGTLLDTARFRALLGEHYGVNPRSVHASILGEHGDSEVPVWSNALIGGLPLSARTVLGKPFERATMDALFERVRRAAYDIIDRKGYTNTAIGLGIGRLVEAIVEDGKSVLPVSVRLHGEYGLSGVCLSLPCVIGRDGVEGRVLPELDDEELAAMKKSAEILKEFIAAIEWPSGQK